MSIEEIATSINLPSIDRFRARTPARVLAGRAGSSYRTTTQLDLRCDHAFARDAVLTEFVLERDFDPLLIEKYQLFLVDSQARDKQDYLRRPDLGRRFSEEARAAIGERCTTHANLQIVIGDGLSTAAIVAQVPKLFPSLVDGAKSRGWTVGQSFVIRHCRVGILNDIGDLLQPDVVVLLIGERPGLATAESLSGYLAYQPRTGHTDANRNLISNIHARGVPVESAARRILDLCSLLRTHQKSGVDVKEQLSLAAADLMLGNG